MKKEILTKLHEKQVELLDLVNEFCLKNNLVYYLFGGTLLGAVRHKGFIPWDDDVDIIMPRKDYEFLQKNIKNYLGDKYFLQTAYSDKGYGRNFAKLRINNTLFVEEVDAHVENRHHGIFLDIFILENSKKRRGLFTKIKYRFSQTLDSFLVLKRGKLKIPLNKKIFNLFPSKFLVRLRDWARKGKGDCYFYNSIGIQPKEIYEPAKKLMFEGKEYLVPNDYNKILSLMYGEYMILPPVNQRITHNPVRINFDTAFEDEKLEG